MDPQQWLDDFQRRIGDMAEKSASLQEELAGANATASSPDGTVVVTVSPTGALLDLDLGKRITEYSPTRIKQMILDVAGQAQRQAAHQVAEVFAPYGGDTEAMRLINRHLPPDDDEPESVFTAAPEDSDPAPSAPSAPSTRPRPESRPDDEEETDEDERPW
ncbi:YbaB/EbfC family nucleoid-associated protein [Saccharopolyspora sp. ID03-671]|uniref:YbaB/EbfC family nucleoid-associated protein n=1 Tax=Saccharopolyspora sp. ID03-671 TaxID=3073066 RepID=UPI003249CA3A